MKKSKTANTKNLEELFLESISAGLVDTTASDVIKPLEWAKKYRSIDEKPFTLARHLPLEQLYNDDHKHIVVMKPAQVGVSEFAVTRVVHALDCGAAFYGANKPGLNIGYLFPTMAALSDFSKERITGLQRESEKLAGLFTDFDDVGFKQAGQSYLYLRGAWSTSALKSFPADILVFDELDEMIASAIALGEKRLRASLIKVKLYISTPTLPGRGIHALYLQSDQMQWHVPCGHCGQSSVLDFFRDVYANGKPFEEWQRYAPERLRQAKMSVICQYCHSPMNRCAPGKWIPMKPEITGIRGYHVPTLAFPMTDLNELAVNSISEDPSQIEEFFRSDLGIPFEKTGSQITDLQLDALAEDLPATLHWRKTVMGVDVGSRWHYRITSEDENGTRYVRAMGAAKDWNELDILMKQYKVQRCVIDAAPETSATETWSKKHSGKVFRAYYNVNLKTLFHVKKDEDIVSINRTGALDSLYNRVALVNEKWSKQLVHDPEIRAHMKAPQRVTVKNNRGELIADWVHSKPDHFYHASVYSLIAELSLPKQSIDSTAFLGSAISGW